MADSVLDSNEKMATSAVGFSYHALNCRESETLAEEVSDVVVEAMSSARETTFDMRHSQTVGLNFGVTVQQLSNQQAPPTPTDEQMRLGSADSSARTSFGTETATFHLGSAGSTTASTATDSSHRRYSGFASDFAAGPSVFSSLLHSSPMTPPDHQALTSSSSAGEGVGLDRIDEAEQQSSGVDQEAGHSTTAIVASVTPISVQLPSEILLRIFKYLPVYMLAHTAQVCRQWRLVSYDNSLWRAHYKRKFFARRSQRQVTQGTGMLDISWRAMYIKRRKKMAASPSLQEVRVENHRNELLLPPSSNLLLCSPHNILGLSRWLLIERCSEGGLNENNVSDFCVLQRQLNTGDFSLIQANSRFTVLAFHRVCNAVFCTLSWGTILVPFASLTWSSIVFSLFIDTASSPTFAAAPVKVFNDAAASATPTALPQVFHSAAEALAPFYDQFLWSESWMFYVVLLMLGLGCWFVHVSKQMLADRMPWHHIIFSTAVVYMMTQALATHSSLMLSDSIVFILMFCSSMANVVFKHRVIHVQYPNVETSLCLNFLVAMFTLSGTGSASIQTPLFGFLGISAVQPNDLLIDTMHCGGPNVGYCIFRRNRVVSGWLQHVGNILLLIVLDSFAQGLRRVQILAFSIALTATATVLFLFGIQPHEDIFTVVMYSVLFSSFFTVSIQLLTGQRSRHSPFSYFRLSSFISLSALIVTWLMAASFWSAFRFFEIDIPTFLVEFSVLFLFRYSCTNLYTIVNDRDSLTFLATVSYWGLLFGVGYIVLASLAGFIIPFGLIFSDSLSF